MSKYKVGDRVLMQMVVDEIKNNDYAPIWVSLEREDTADGMWLKEEQIDKYAYKGESKTYEDGLNDAWELARKMTSWIYSDRKKVLGFGYSSDVFNQYTYQEALAKIEAYEKEQQINVGDVVECFSDYKGVVLDIDTDFKTLDVFTENGCVEGLAITDVKKTGRHIDIEHILEQIRGNE